MRVAVHWSTSRKHRVLRNAQNVFMFLGCAAVGFCAFAYFHAGAFQAYEQWRFAKTLQSSVHDVSESTPTHPPESLRLLAHEGSPVGRIEIPRLALSVIVAEGIKPRTLRLAVGHIPGTAFPDESGNVGIAGHRDTFFRELGKIRRDDIIIVGTLGGSSEYSVDWTRVANPRISMFWIFQVSLCSRSLLAIRFTTQARHLKGLLCGQGGSTRCGFKRHPRARSRTRHCSARLRASAVNPGSSRILDSGRPFSHSSAASTALAAKSVPGGPSSLAIAKRGFRKRDSGDRWRSSLSSSTSSAERGSSMAMCSCSEHS